MSETATDAAAGAGTGADAGKGTDAGKGAAGAGAAGTGAAGGDNKGTVLGGDDSSKAKANADGSTAATGAPAKYEYKAPEGVTIDQDGLGAFEKVAKAANLSNDQFKLVMDHGLAMISARDKAASDALGQRIATDEATDLKALRDDKEFGGVNYDETLRLAGLGFTKLATADEIKMVNEHTIMDPATGKVTRVGQNAMLIRIFARAGKAMKEDTSALGTGSGAGSGQKSEVDIQKEMYPSMFNADGSQKQR